MEIDLIRTKNYIASVIRTAVLLVLTLQLSSCASTPPVKKNLTYGQKKRKTMLSINQVITGNIKRFEYCYKQAASKNNVTGRITLVFTVRRDGKVQRAGVINDSMPIKFKACLIRALWTLNFPPPIIGRPIKIQQPLEF